MSKQKGVSAEEKRKRMLQIFHEKKEFFQLKELEKIAPKEKGIVEQSVKDVVQSLVDDGLVDSDKIGTSVYFWAFPSKTKHSKKRQLENVTDKLNDVNKKIKISQENVAAAKIGREPTQKRNEVLQRVAQLTAEEKLLLKKIQDYEVCDKMENESQIAIESANRWLCNIQCVVSYCEKKFSIDQKTLQEHFGIDPNMEFL
ncbi:meiotic nuclear division protein 1 homolog [Zootermopsis nevadensis]|uniref:Meiotic nuclear division protein 1 homolog n=1 Tax=Zootermopsis nevadensis TaxID=136037 RepID=A0A067R732_ZOONE|nr:meiotic nuclear division protein 1 homolog [Zootermopsis nevadensis]XP_021922289.1 meiotic nuclear division protein 1 homolog [Zootermopsis nevadensis]KDR18233.1 Meiotic nuclear division protein 1-like protein [Zootermopsis nevadensis]